MKRSDVKKTFENRANIKSYAEPECDNCGLPLVFALETATGGQFSVDIRSILQCLKIAEDEGFTPSIDVEWWNSIRNHYSL